MSTRRHFVSGIALSTCALLLSPVPGIRGRSRVATRIGSLLGLIPRDPAEVSPAEFKPVKGQGFQLEAPGGHRLRVTLKEVAERGACRSDTGHRVEQFSLLFEGPATEDIEQGNFVLSHPDHGECELFMVPTEPKGKRCYYQASFSRLV